MEGVGGKPACRQAGNFCPRALAVLCRAAGAARENSTTTLLFTLTGGESKNLDDIKIGLWGKC